MTIADRLLRHQRALDRHRRHHAALDRHFHGRAAAALDQALVQGRADSGSLSHHREQHALSGRTDGRHRRAARRLRSRARSHRRRWPTNTASRPFSPPCKRMLDQSEAAARAKIRAIAGRRRTATRRFSTTTASPTSRLPISVKVIVAGDEMTVDLVRDRRRRCKGCINSGYYGGGRTARGWPSSI